MANPMHKAMVYLGLVDEAYDDDPMPAAPVAPVSRADRTERHETKRAEVTPLRRPAQSRHAAPGMNEILTVRPGSALDFLAAVHEQRTPLLADYGQHATGLYEVLNNQHEVVMVWATDIPSYLTYRKNRDTTRGLTDDGTTDDRIVAWERTSAEFVTGGDHHIMTPHPRTVYGPDDWEDATLDEWLKGNATVSLEDE